ncbi:MAG: glycosyltransferase family 9 protein [Patescibacteria group bacterium]
MTELLNRLYRLTLLVHCVLFSLVRGKSGIIGKPKTIIVVLTGKLGDVVCGTPVLSALRKHLREVRVVAAGGPILIPLLKDSGLAEEYLNLDSKDFFSQVKSLKADVALVTGPSFVPTALLYLADIPLVVAPEVLDGESLGDTLPYKILRRLISTFPYRMGKYAPRERLRALESLGIIEEDTQKHLGFSENAGQSAVDYFKNNNLDGKLVVGMAVTAGNKIKEWPEERFAETANYLVEKHQAKVIIFGGPEDRTKIQNTLQKIKYPESIFSTQGKLNIDELKAYISKLNLFISVDTGPIYIAEAFGVPTVDIVGPMDEREQPPQGLLHRSVLPPSRVHPELHILNARHYEEKEALRQTLSITPEAVILATDKLIGDILQK